MIWAILALAALPGSRAMAQEPGGSGAAPAPVPAPAEAEPAPAEAQPAEAQPAEAQPAYAPAPAPTEVEAAPSDPAPSGLWLDGGLAVLAGGRTFMPTAWARVDVGIPLRALEGLSIQLPLFVSRSTYSEIVYDNLGFPTTVDGGKTIYLGAAPGVSYELPIIERGWRFSAYGELGGGVMLSFVDVPDAPYTPGYTDTIVEGMVRSAIGARFTLPFGLFASVQPVGFAVFFGHGGHASFDFATTVGYRFR